MTEHRVRVVEKNLFLDDQKVFFVNQYSNLVDALWFVIDTTTLDGVSVGNSDVYVSWKLGDQAYLFKLTMTQTSTGWESTWPVPDECTQIVGVATVELQLWSKGASTSSGSYLWVSNGLIMSINKANGTPVDLVDPANVLVEQVAEYANQAEQSAQAAQDAADAAQEVVDENLADYLKKSGGDMSGDINMGNYNIGHIAKLFGSSGTTNYIQFLVRGCGGTATRICGTNYGGESQSVEAGNGVVSLNSNGDVNLNSGTGTINANNKRIQNVASPTASSDAATMGYVADEISRLKESCAAAYAPISAAIRPTVSGNPILVQDSVAWPLQSLILHGKTTQDGAPSPDNPIPLVSAGDDGQIDVTVCGGNLLHLTDKSGTVGGVQYAVSNGTITLNGTSSNNNGVFVVGHSYTGDTIALHLPAGIYKLSGMAEGTTLYGYKTGSEVKEVKFSDIETTLNEDTDFVSISVRWYNDTQFDNVTLTPILNVGSTALPWQPYTGKTITISIPNGLPGIPVDSGGNYTDSDGQQWICDEIDIKSGKHIKKVKKMVFNGSESWFRESNKIGNRYKYYFGEKVKPSDKTIGTTSMNSNFPLGESKATWNTKNVYTIWNDEASTALYVSLNGTETLEEFKSYLSNNNMTVLYIPAEIQEEENSYEELSSQNGATTAYTTADTDLTMQYVADAQKYIDNKIGAISTAMLKE